MAYYKYCAKYIFQPVWIRRGVCLIIGKLLSGKNNRMRQIPVWIIKSVIPGVCH